MFQTSTKARRSSWGWLCVAVAATVVAPAQGQAPRDQHEAHRLHQDPKAYIAALEDPKRDAYQKPHEVMQALGVRPGEVIADIGAGSGYFTVRLAQHVGPAGHVYAVDVSPDMIRHLHQRVRDMELLNVSPILAPPDDPLLPQPVDRFLVVDVWHHVEDQSGYLAKLRNRLKPGGQVIMIDFQKRDLPVGPPLAMKIARDDLIRQMEAHGFRLATEHTFLPYQYFLVFETSPSPSQSPASTGDAAAASPPNAVQHEMRLLLAALQGAVAAIADDDLARVPSLIHGIHEARDATEAAIENGRYKPPKNPDRIDAFKAMDDSFHEQLVTLVKAAQANDLAATTTQFGAVLQQCQGCHALFRELPVSRPATPGEH
jgi:ubiquinone/menaquinone biosynthesis C-methylase UbiE/cytochrome c556